MFDIINTNLSASVADNGTFTVAYPAGRGIGSYTGGYAHKLYANGTLFYAPRDFTLAFTSVITATWKADTTLAAGTTVSLQVDRSAPDGSVVFDKTHPKLDVSIISLGAPVAASANAICLSQSLSITPALALLNGATLGVLDVPRAIVAAWTTTAVLTFTGKGLYGSTIVETSASGASHTGKKAFKSITSITASAGITGLTVGTGDVFGLPFRLAGTGFVLRELEDSAVATAGTVVAGVNTFATGITGDVRGTYDPNSSADGAKSFQLIVAGADPADVGVAQFAG